MELPRRVLTPGWATAYVEPPVPYVPGGRDRAGWDCWGLVRVAYREQFGIDLPAFSGAYGDPTEDEQADLISELVEAQKLEPCWLPVYDPKPGDVLSVSLLGHESHVALYVEGDRMLHTVEKWNTRIERIGPAWKRRIRGTFRHRLR